MVNNSAELKPKRGFETIHDFLAMFVDIWKKILFAVLFWCPIHVTPVRGLSEEPMTARHL